MCICTCVQVRGQCPTSSQPLSTASFKVSLLLELTDCAWLHCLASKPQRSLVYLPSPEIVGVYCHDCACDMGAGNLSTVHDVCGKCFTDSHFACCLVVHSPCRFLSGLFPMFWSLILLLVCSHQDPSVYLKETDDWKWEKNSWGLSLGRLTPFHWVHGQPKTFQRHISVTSFS